MGHEYDRQKQFHLTPLEFFTKLDFLNWHRYFAILKELSKYSPSSILEIGPGEGTIRKTYESFTKTYKTADVNTNLKPDFLSDVRTLIPKAEQSFDAVIAADILEHIAFSDMPSALNNIKKYLSKNGKAFITIPHRAWFLFFLHWINYKHHIVRAPDWMRKFYRKLLGKKMWIDPDHQWEIGDGVHTIEGVEAVMKNAGFRIVKRSALPYVDFWVLEK